MTAVRVDCVKKVASFRLTDPEFDYTTALNELAGRQREFASWSLME